MKPISEDQQRLLDVASHAHGLITIYAARAKLLDLSEQMIRRHLDALVKKGYLGSGYVPQPEEWGDRLVKLYYTLKPAEEGKESGAAYLKRTKERQARSKKPKPWKKGQTLPLPGRLWHDQTAVALLSAFGGPGTKFDFDFNRGAPPVTLMKISDGIAVLPNAIQLALEVERMRRRSANAWKKDILTGILPSIHVWAAARAGNAHLIVTPMRLRGDLKRVVRECTMDSGGKRASGYYWLPTEDPWADAVWESLGGIVKESLSGVRTMREMSPRHLAAVAELRMRRESAAKARERRAAVAKSADSENVAERKCVPGSEEAKRRFYALIGSMGHGRPLAGKPARVSPGASAAPESLDERECVPGSEEAKRRFEEMIERLNAGVLPTGQLAGSPQVLPSRAVQSQTQPDATSRAQPAKPTD